MMDGWGLLFVAAFMGWFALFRLLARRKGARPVALREIEAFSRLPVTVGQAVETGRRLHISLGTGAMGDVNSASTLAGLALLDQVSDAAVISDKPPIVTTADGITALLAEDTLRSVYKRKNALARYDPNSAQVAGTDAYAFASAITGLTKDEAVAGTILIGAVGPEAILLTEAGHRAEVTTLAGADDPAAQAILFAAANNPLVGEDVFAGGAYIASGLPAHIASLRAQDMMRLIVGAVILIGTVMATSGLLK